MGPYSRQDGLTAHTDPIPGPKRRPQEDSLREPATLLRVTGCRHASLQPRREHPLQQRPNRRAFWPNRARNSRTAAHRTTHLMTTCAVGTTPFQWGVIDDYATMATTTSRARHDPPRAGPGPVTSVGLTASASPEPTHPLSTNSPGPRTPTRSRGTHDAAPLNPA